MVQPFTHSHHLPGSDVVNFNIASSLEARPVAVVCVCCMCSLKLLGIEDTKLTAVWAASLILFFFLSGEKWPFSFLLQCWLICQQKFKLMPAAVIGLAYGQAL